MITYKNKTFCQFNKLCKLPCKRALTSTIQLSAKNCGLKVSRFTYPPFDYDEDKVICDYQDKGE